MPAFIRIDGVDGDVNVHSAANVELTVKVLDGRGTFYGAMTDVDLAIRVVDTGQVTERESGLVYSGESGGLNESVMQDSMETMKKAWKDASGTPEGDATDASSAFGDGSVRDAAGPLVAGADGFTGGIFVGTGDAAPNGRLYLATDVGVFAQSAGDLNDWQSRDGTGGGTASGGGDDVLIGGLTGFEPLPHCAGFDLV